jgi:hypothetical protein
MKRSINLLLICLTLIIGLLTGCQLAGNRLEAGGAYAPVTTNELGQVVPLTAPETELFVADTAFKLAYDSLNLAFTTERDNRELFWGMSPDIKHTLDALRPKAVAIVKQYALVRTICLANPNPANLSQVQYVLAEVRRLASTASAALISVSPAPQTINP